MSLTVDFNSTTTESAASDRFVEYAARVVAAWAGYGELGEHVVYERSGRWVVAAGVRVRVVLTTKEVVVSHDGRESRRTWTGDPADALAAALAEASPDPWRAYGWLAFDFAAPRHGVAERLPDDQVLAHLMVPDFEAVVSVDGIDTGTAPSAVATRLRELARSAVQPGCASPIDVMSESDRYRERVAAAVGEIAEGRYQKVILSRRVDVPFPVDLPGTYVRGRVANTPARSFLFRLGEVAGAGFSPELVVAVTADGDVAAEPLAGTRAFGRSEDSDAAARAELFSDAKEIAEHALSARACVEELESVTVPGTTVVSEFMVVRERGSVQHLASTVRGRLDAGRGPWSALSAVFPSITASGYPKGPAVEAIYRIEDEPREVYSGAIVMASSDGALEATLALRSVFVSGGRAWLRAGAGVVAQSSPDREYEETCEKLASVAPYVVRAHVPDVVRDEREAL